MSRQLVPIYNRKLKISMAVRGWNDVRASKRTADTEERLQYLQMPPDLGEWELGTYFTLTQHDLELLQQRRRAYNRLGFAVQLCVLRYLGRTLSDIKEVPVQVLRYIAKQINADVESLASYGEREATKYEHLEEIRKRNTAIRHLP
jgi:TnpA family transposase